MSGIERLGNVYFKVSDVNRSAHFYQDQLGLDLKFRDDDHWVAFDAGGTTLALMPQGDRPEHGAIPAFRVEDVDAWAQQAKQRGLQVGPVQEGAHERTVDVHDPDGNRLVIYSHR